MITVTPKAAERLRIMLTSHNKQATEKKLPQSQGFRFGIKAGGCSGFEYVFGPATATDKFDHVSESNDILIYVDPKMLRFVDGTEIDHTGNILQLKDGLIFNNPNAKSGCGCGVSFEIK